MRRLARLALLLALCGPGLAPPARAATPPVSAAPVAKVGRNAWTERIREASNTVVEARLRHATALKDLQVARHRHRARGARKQELLVERQESQAALEKAERHMEQLLEEARRAGVPPGWIDDALEPGPASPRP